MPSFEMIFAVIVCCIMLFIGIFVLDTVSKNIILEDSIKSDDKIGAVSNIDSSFVSFMDASGSKTGVINKLSSVDNDWVLTFNDDLSDYRFTGVDTTELYFLQYAFDNQEQVTMSYTVEGDVYTLEGVTMSSPEPVSNDPNVDSPGVPSDTGFNLWLYVPIWVVILSVSGGALVYSLYHRRRVNAMVRGFEERLNSEENIEEQITHKKANKKQKTEDMSLLPVPLDGRYRVEQADKLLDEKSKNKKYRKKKEKED